MAAFERARPELEAASISVLAASCDGKDEATSTVAELGIHYPVGYGLDLETTATTLGAYYETRRGILHGTGFLLRPDRTIAVACYSSGAIGRLLPDEIQRVVAHWVSRG